jgi:pyruvate dehydrogenase E2 component (dihydrolipoamide acetyltransferase)
VAILGVARASKQPVYQNSDNKFVPHNILPLSLSYDHRAIDGAEGARFLRWICNALEDPFLALMEGGM